MKKAGFFCLILFPLLAIAQFPAPDFFQITVQYIHLGESGWCDNHLVQGPNYCNLFSWEAPDTNNTPATLTGYRLYKDNIFFLSTASTLADTTGGYIAGFYVTATYENPAGESEPSNVVVIESLPVAAPEADAPQKTGIWFDPVRRILILEGADAGQILRVYNIQGALLLDTKVVSDAQSLASLPPGVYVAVLTDVSGLRRSHLVVMER